MPTIVDTPNNNVINVVASNDVILVPQDASTVVTITTAGPPGGQGNTGAPGAGVDTLILTTAYTNGEATTIYRGTPVCLVAGVIRIAKSTAPYTKVIGLLYDASLAPGVAGRVQTLGIMSSIISQWNLVSSSVGGLVPPNSYFLNTLGQLSLTPPGSTGEVIASLGYATSSTDFVIEIGTPIQL